MRKLIVALLLLFSQTAHADNITTPKGFSGTQGTQYLKATNGKLYEISLCMTTDGAGNVLPCAGSGGSSAPTLVTQGAANDGSSPWHVIDDAWMANFDAWKGFADVNLSTLAKDLTLSNFAAANHADLQDVEAIINQVDEDVLDFKDEAHVDAGLSLAKLEAIRLLVKSLDTDFDVALSTRASESSLSGFRSDFNAWKTWADVALSTRASETTLSALSAKFNSLGQKTMPNSAPVVIASDQSAIPSSQSGTWNTGRTWTLGSGTDSVASVQSGAWSTGRTWSLLNSTDSVNAVQSGTWTVQQGTPPWTVSQSGAWTTGRTWTLSNATDSVAATQSGTWNTGRTWTLASGTDSIAAVQSGTWNTRLQDAAGTGITSTLVSAKQSLDVNVTQSALPSGAATSALQTTGNTSVGNIDIKTPALGQTSTLSAARPVVQPADLTLVSQNVTTQDLVSASATQAYGQVVWTGTPTANSAAIFTTSSYQSGIITIKGTWTGTLSVETSQDGGTSWVSHTTRLLGGSIYQANFTANAQVSINLAGKTNVRVRASAAMTGTASVTLLETFNGEGFYIANSLRIADGSNTTVQTPLTIKAASTSPASTDTAAVVTLSPNAANTTHAVSASSVGTSSASSLAANANRAGVDIANTSTARISCAFGVTAVLNSGITLFPGGTWRMTRETFSNAAMNCIAGRAASNLSILETTR